MTSEEEETKKKADASAAQYEQETGQPAPEEPGIEEDYTIEEGASLLFGGPAASMAKRAGGLAVNKASKGVMEKVKEKGPKPTLSSVGQDVRDELVRDANKMESFNKDPHMYMENRALMDKQSRMSAQKALDLKKGIGISKNAKAAEEPLVFEGSQAKETRRMMDPSKKFETTQVVADVNKGKVAPSASKVEVREPGVRDAKFPGFDGESHQTRMKNKAVDDQIELIRRRMSGK